MCVFCIGQLEEKCLTAQKDITMQTRKSIDLKKELKRRQAEAEELRKEVCIHVDQFQRAILAKLCCCLFSNICR